MKYLLIVAHGSRRQASNEEVHGLADLVSAQSVCSFDQVRAAFLEIAEPSIPDGLEKCINEGATEIVIFPYFLAAGRHVVDDIPDEANKITRRYPDIRISIADYLGSYSDIPALIAHRLASSSQ